MQQFRDPHPREWVSLGLLTILVAMHIHPHSLIGTTTAMQRNYLSLDDEVKFTFPGEEKRILRRHWQEIASDIQIISINLHKSPCFPRVFPEFSEVFRSFSPRFPHVFPGVTTAAWWLPAAVKPMARAWWPLGFAGVRRFDVGWIGATWYIRILCGFPI